MKIIFLLPGTEGRPLPLNGESIRYGTAASSGTDQSVILVGEYLANQGHNVTIVLDKTDFKTVNLVNYTDFTYKGIGNEIDILNVNLLAPMLLTNKYIKENSKGLIINITSSCVTRPYGTLNTAYYTSKNGLTAFTNSIREELTLENFRVVEIIPSRTDTNMTIDKHNALSPIEVANAVLLAISNPVIQQIIIKHPNR